METNKYNKTGDRLTIIGKSVSVGGLAQMIRRIQEAKENGRNIDEILAKEAAKNIGPNNKEYDLNNQ